LIKHNVSTVQSWLALAGWLAVCFGAASFGAQFSPDTWYAQLAKPSWTPPGWLFPVVWTLLYAMMGIAAWLVWLRDGFAAGALPLGFFILQLLLNAVWSWFFFGQHRIGLALVDIALLWLALLATVAIFWRHHAVAGLLLLPYLLWVSFAAMLNFAIWRMNT
jgi:tryptophan-rich sensory protein